MTTIKIFIFLIFIHCVSGNKYCAFEHDGEAKYYVCHRNEYCCRLGCCVNLAFQFYQMWYFWLLLIFMFMVCSGGGWWYRFCRQQEVSTAYPTTLSTLERSTANAVTSHLDHRNVVVQQHQRRRSESARRSRVSHHSGDPSTMYLQRIWKGGSTHHQIPPPNYYSNSRIVYHQNGTVLTGNPANYFHSGSITRSPTATTPPPPPSTQYHCPYYQLYGPPPSYDSIVHISQTLGQPAVSLIPAAATETVDNVTLDTVENNCHVDDVVTNDQQPSTSSKLNVDETTSINDSNNQTIVRSPSQISAV